MEFRKICRRVTAVENYPVDVKEGSALEFSSFEQLQTLLHGPPSKLCLIPLLSFFSHQCRVRSKNNGFVTQIEIFNLRIVCQPEFCRQGRFGSGRWCACRPRCA